MHRKVQIKKPLYRRSFEINDEIFVTTFFLNKKVKNPDNDDHLKNVQKRATYG